MTDLWAEGQMGIEIEMYWVSENGNAGDVEWERDGQR